jgi:hypothetical protein
VLRYCVRHSIHTQLQAAVPADQANYQYLVIPKMNTALTFWNVMAYDLAALTFDPLLTRFHSYEFTGGWDSVVSLKSISPPTVFDESTDRK